MNNLFLSRKIIGSRIRQIRRKKNISTIELSEYLSCSQEYVYRIEIGLVKLDIDKIFMISKYLNITVDTLFSNIGFQATELQKREISICYYQAECII